MSQKSIKKNTIYNAIKTISAIIFPLITFPYASRVLLPDNMGKINFGMSIISYFSLIASLGITTYAVRECSAVRDDKEKLGQTASQIFSINVVTTAVAYIALALTLIFYRKLDNYRVLIIVLSITIVSATLGADWLNSAMEDFEFITIRTVGFQVLSLVLMFVFVHKPEDYMKYAIISVIAAAGASISNIWYRRRYCKVVFIRDLFHSIEWKRHMTPIIYLFVMILAQTIFSSVDSTMLGLMHGDYEVGIYGTAHKILNIVNQLISSLLWVIMPRMSYYFAEGDYENINRLLRQVLQFNITLGLPSLVGMTVLANDIIGVVAGAEYAEAAPVLQILMISFAFSLVGGSFLGNAVLLPSKQEKYYMIVCCIAAVVNIITNYITIPYWGPKAAAGTTALCSLVIMVLLLLKVDKRIHIDRIISLAAAPVIGCVLIVAVCLLCRGLENLFVRTFVSVGVSVVVYFIVQIAMRNELVVSLLEGLKNRFIKHGN